MHWVSVRESGKEHVISQLLKALSWVGLGLGFRVSSREHEGDIWQCAPQVSFRGYRSQGCSQWPEEAKQQGFRISFFICALAPNYAVSPKVYKEEQQLVSVSDWSNVVFRSKALANFGGLSQISLCLVQNA